MPSTTSTMPPLARILLWSVGLLSAVAYLWMNEQGPLWLRVVIKPLPVLCLALWTGLTQRTRYGLRLTAGLTLALIGDLFLIFPGEPAFLAGLASNLLAHLCYIAAFLTAERALKPLRALPFVLWVGILCVILFPGLGGMKIPVLLYSAAIASMMWRAAAVIGDPSSPRTSQWAGLLGAIGFALCDSFIALDKFHHHIEHAQPIIMIAYWLGQLGISWSAQRGVPSPQPAFALAESSNMSR